MKFPVIDTNGNTIHIVEKKIGDPSHPATSEVLIAADGKTYRKIGPGRVEECTVMVEDTPNAKLEEAQAALDASNHADQAAHATDTGPVSEKSDPLTGSLKLGQAATTAEEADAAGMLAASDDLDLAPGDELDGKVEMA